MYKKHYYFCLLLLVSQQLLFSQTYAFKKKFSPSEHTEFLGYTKEIFSLNKNIAYSFSSTDAQAKFADMSDQIQYNDTYFQKLKAGLAKDSLDPVTLNDYGNYYVYKGDKSLAKKYFKKSLDNLSLQKLIKKDSAHFYSFRGILKMNLENEGAVIDIEKALKVNPNDSIAIQFYPMMLIQQNRFTEARQICIAALDKKTDQPLMSYFFLNMISLWEKLAEFNDPAKKEENRKKNYDEIFDYSIANKYATLYKSNNQVQNLKKMAEVLGLFLKMHLFELDDNDKVIYSYTAAELTKIKTLEKEFRELESKGKINAFSANKSLSALYFMLNNRDKAISHAKKAITLFPDTKKSTWFTITECYDLLLCLYQLENDDLNFKKLLEEKIAKSSEGQKAIKDYLSMAYLYLYKKDYAQSESWCAKAREIDMDDFDALCLTSHLKFMTGPNLLDTSTGVYYLQQAIAHAKNDWDSYSAGLQASIYMILRGNAGDANIVVENIEKCRKISENKCTICDELMEKYITVTP